MSNTCPSAKTLLGFSEELNRWCVIQIRCKRWGCRHCGQRKVTHLGWRCEDAQPNRLITLTVNNPLWESPRSAYDGTKGRVTQLATRLRRQHGEFEYMKVLEVTRLGWPHYHLIVRSKYIPHSTISGIWGDLTGATIVDVRQIKKRQDVYFYVVKYLSKQKYIPWTNRRVSWSREFFPPNDFKAPNPLKLFDPCWVDDHPADVIRRHYHPLFLNPLSRDCWVLEGGEGFTIGQPIRLRFRKKRRDN